jgi:DNA-binding XRE family transcriptional regulator
MAKKKKCDYCPNKASVTIEGKNLCPKHYFHKLNEVDIPFGPKSRRENHWSVLLRELRSEAGMTQRDLARKTRMSQRTIADYENISYPRQLSIYKVERLLKELGYDLDAVLAKKNV